MARAPKAATGTAVANWDEELARQAQMAAGMEESTASGQFFSLKNGQLSFNDTPLPNNEMAVVIVAHVLENVFYEGEYDTNEPQAPTCFAFGSEESTLTPHQVVIDADKAQNDTCKGCPQNEWGTAERGRGKACRNVRRLAMIPAGSFNKSTGKFEPESKADHYESAQIAYMKLSLTSVKGFSAFVKQVAGALKRPPHGIFTRVKVVPDAVTQFKVVFEPLGQIPGPLMGAVMTRHEEAVAAIDFPYALADESVEKPKGRGAKAKAAPAAKSTRRGKY